MSINPGLEEVYKHHHTNARGRNFVLLKDERGSFLKRYIGEGKHILDIGCRDGELTKEYALDNDVLGLDIDSEALSIAQEKIPNLKVKQTDLNAEWDLPNNYFDVVVAAEVLEHVYYPGKVLGKVSAVLKPGGKFIGSVPHAFSLQNRVKFLFGIKDGTPLSDPTHINHFTYSEFTDLLNRYFINVHIEPIVSNKFKVVNYINPFICAHTLLFYGEKSN